MEDGDGVDTVAGITQSTMMECQRRCVAHSTKAFGQRSRKCSQADGRGAGSGRTLAQQAMAMERRPSSRLGRRDAMLARAVLRGTT